MTTNRYHLLGRTGLRVSPIALGALTFGEGGWHTGEGTARDIFVRYVEAGGNFVDTAVNYGGGRSEEMLGTFMKETGIRDRLVVATKFAVATRPGDPNSGGNGRKNILASLDTSLRRLRTDYVDLYWLHMWDAMTPVEEVMSTLDALVRSGRIRECARELGRTPAQVALNWVARRPGVVSTLISVTRLAQLDENLRALDFEIPSAMAERIQEVSLPEPVYPHYFSGPAMGPMINAGTTVTAD